MTSAAAAGPAGEAALRAARQAARVAVRVAEDVGRLLLALRADPPPGGPQALRDAADRAADARAHALLDELAPGDAVLSEESPDSSARLSAPRVWIVDPLDGTREYGEPGRTDWAVHVAWWTVADGLVAGAVALPGLGMVLDSATVAPVERPSPDRPRHVLVSRSRPPAAAAPVAEALRRRGGPAATIVTRGSAGAKVAAVVHGEADVYLETGGLHEWDTAAPVAVARAAGLAVVTPDGSPVLFNRPDPRQDGVVVCRPDLLAVVLAAIAASAGS